MADTLLPRNTLSKDERLHGRKEIAALLSGGRFRTASDFVRYCSRPNGLEHSRIMVSVPKKLFKRAVRRNALKRRIRESYRLQKGLVPPERSADILFIYTSKEMASGSEIFAAVGKILNDLAHGREKKE